MKAAVALALAVFCGVAAQVAPRAPAPSSPEGDAKPAERPVLLNTGKPIQVGFACTNDDIQWAGLSCSDEEPCPVYLEISAAEPVGNKIFAAGNFHSSSATLYSIVLASDDAGKTWREAHERLRGATLDRIQFVDFENGWISGQVVQPLPQDPFLLITSDGGSTWRQRPLFSETRGGSILQFWFTSRNSGSLVLDRGQAGDLGRYELYESPNGGETWMLRETNERPIRLKRSAAANPDWRIRADAASRAFSIERRQTDRWVPLSAFAVAVEACKPAAVEAPAPPAVEETPPGVEKAPPVPAPAAPRRPPTLKRPPA